jgi:hypothetical protein
MRIFDHNVNSVQLCATIDYTEMFYLPDTKEYVVVWHDNVLSSHDNELDALRKYRAILDRPRSDDNR